MSRGKKGKVTQTTMCVKINNEIMEKLITLPTWNFNKNKTINIVLKKGIISILEKELKKQLKLDL